MKLSVITPTPDVPRPFALLSGTFEERLAKAKKFGYDGVELVVVRPNQIDAKDIKAQVETHGLAVSAIASMGINPIDGLTLLSEDAAASRAAVERLNGLIDVAAAVGAPFVIIGVFHGRLASHPGGDGYTYLVHLLRSAVERAAASGVRLALEPVNRYHSDINTIAEGLALIEAIDHSHVGLLLDMYHANIEEPSICASCTAAMTAGRLLHVHVADSNRLGPGYGHLDIPGIVARLSALGYQGYLSPDHADKPDPDTAAAATANYLRRLIPQ